MDLRVNNKTLVDYVAATFAHLIKPVTLIVAAVMFLVYEAAIVIPLTQASESHIFEILRVFKDYSLILRIFAMLVWWLACVYLAVYWFRRKTEHGQARFAIIVKDLVSNPATAAIIGLYGISSAYIPKSNYFFFIALLITLMLSAKVSASDLLNELWRYIKATWQIILPALALISVGFAYAPHLARWLTYDPHASLEKTMERIVVSGMVMGVLQIILLIISALIIALTYADYYKKSHHIKG